MIEMFNLVLDRLFNRWDEEEQWYRDSKKLLSNVRNQGLDLISFSDHIELDNVDSEIRELGERLTEHAADAPESVPRQLATDVRLTGNICVELYNAFSKRRDDNPLEFMNILLYQEERRRIGSDTEIDEENVSELLQRYRFDEQIEAQIGIGEGTVDLDEEQLHQLAESLGIPQGELDLSNEGIAAVMAQIRNEGVEDTSEVIQLVSDQLVDSDDEEIVEKLPPSGGETEQELSLVADELDDLVGSAMVPLVEILLVELPEELIDKIDEEYY